ncbi:uncharacterized protein LOC114535324 [Dendronephthya gigantea]|uniref:uncharacterized protein LOC114535324 n=1 Tax=Dendronephthya gigantea TaxID=151771 RepID=UPI001069E71C|nr:uncharacterized protein LOC114535324 [Dendronephthya gigantea]
MSEQQVVAIARVLAASKEKRVGVVDVLVKETTSSARQSVNVDTPQNTERERDNRDKRSRTRGQAQGFRLSSANSQLLQSEDALREKEHKDVKDFIGTLDEELVRKLAIRSLRRGIGSMDYIDTLLIMEDDLDEDPEDDQLGDFGEQSSDVGQQDLDQPEEPPNAAAPDWCVCGKCRPMPQEIENKCCK